MLQDTGPTAGLPGFGTTEPRTSVLPLLARTSPQLSRQRIKDVEARSTIASGSKCRGVGFVTRELNGNIGGTEVNFLPGCSNM